MRKRAEDVDRTRQRIVEAAVHLHGTAGPAATSIAAIAERAGVTRLTVYRHFPDDTALFTACSAHWLARQTLPDPDGWARIADPVERLAVGLADLYRHYREGEAMLALVHRDQHVVPPAVRDLRLGAFRRYVDTLADAWPRPHDPVRTAVIGHAAAFTTWHSLCRDQQLTNEQAVDVMTALVRTVHATRP
ncbi:hypothetical protein GCM10020229_35240 [Kitasatospora albolonga]|uniref:TetR/AcrR family transcriptional regulator n=1 Tax=Kitasatospora albolonga TaxID=68173 RepID=UPI0031E8B49B